MHKSSLLEIIRTFTPKELIKFEDFVNSPYFNKNKNVIKLFAEVIKYRPEFNNENLEKELVWKKLFPEKNYNYGIMKNIIHDLTGLSEKFILLEKYSGESFRCELDLIEAGNSRNLQKFTSGKLDQFEKKIKSEADPNKYSSINGFLTVAGGFYDTKSSFIHEYNLKQDREEYLRLASDYSLFNFLVRSFKLLHNTFANEVHGNRPVRKTLLEKFFVKLKEHSILEDLLINENENKDQDKISKIVMCFHLMYKAVTSDRDIAEYYKFKSYLRENIELFSGHEIKNLNNCRNTCAILLKISDSEVAKESLDWIKFLMEKNIILLRSGLMYNTTMLNAVNYSVRLKEISFAEEFLNRYSGNLPAESRENTTNYCMAMIHFGKGNFGKSLEYLSRISDEKLIRKYFVKRLYLKIYYELNDYESFIYAFDTFSHFKKRNKLTNETRAMAFNNFGSNIRSLFKLRNSFEKFESIKLRKETGDQIWFIEKIDEIEKVII
ncbi:MAG TPA: hypothetical protein PK294_01195 [Ignavibacteria bacterium]|nr:hypothetical protein [Ignavibacteria bacterium]